MNIERLKDEQIEAAKKVVVKDEFRKQELIGGASQAFHGNTVVSAVAVLDSNLDVVEQQTATSETRMPYIPEFLYFREGPALIAAYRKLKQKPDMLIIGANGILHPLRIGMASQIGVVLDVPAIGVAKQLLCGQVDEDGRISCNNEIRGVALKTREHSRPLYISPGHKVSLETSVEIVKKSIRYPHKLPEQLHIAHRLANKARDELAH
ncbi:endonuclease V [Candidatus Woesearchaeota archaeon]|nr:endonuclease V [Candidatus Woesearchaeota archaeon]